MWKLIIEDDQGHQTAVNLVRDEYSLGRAAENTVRLTERNISRQHAVLRRVGEDDGQGDGGWFLEDLSSYNGVFVNGNRTGEPHGLQHGDLIQLGDYRLELQDEAQAALAQSRSAAATIPALPGAQPSQAPSNRLFMLVGPTPGVEFALGDQPMLLGRGEECDIAINHGSVSRVHAEVRPIAGQQGQGYEVIDRGSANGIRVNGAELERTILDARDAIELGDVVLKFIPAGTYYTPGADESQQIAALPPDFAQAPPADGGSPMVKIMAAIAVAAAVVGLVIVVLAMSRPAPPPVTSADPTAQVLAEAQALAGSDIEAAHKRLLAGIPATSNARQSTTFRAIEARWADHVMAQAEAESDLVKKRALLERVARATSVDSGRRKKAASMLAGLDEGGTDVSSLEKDDGDKPFPGTDASAVAEPGDVDAGDGDESGTDDGGGDGAPDGSGDGGTTTAPAPKPVTAPAPRPVAPAPQPTAKKKSLQELMFSGDRKDQVQAKNILKGIVASGRGSDYHKRMLKSLCRQVGDASCSN